MFEEKDDRRPAGAPNIALPSSTPATYDWTTTDNRLGKIILEGGPKFQGLCGSCWAMASSTIMEAYMCINYNQCYALSSNYAASCSKAKPEARVDGCNGNNAVISLHYLRIGYQVKPESLNGNPAASFLKFNSDGDEILADDKAKCPTAVDTSPLYQFPSNYINSGNLPKMSIFKAPAGFSRLSLNNKIKQYIWAYGPAMTKIDADGLKNYNGETITDPNYCNKVAEHSVVIVGWKRDDSNREVWILRNSWGEKWGDEGYLYTLISDDNVCGIATSAVFLANANNVDPDRNFLNPKSTDPAWFVQLPSTRYALI